MTSQGVSFTEVQEGLNYCKYYSQGLITRIIWIQDSFTCYVLLTVYTRVQVDSSISQIEILKSLFGPKFETLV